MARDPFAGLRRKLQARSPRRIGAGPEARSAVALILAGARQKDFAVLLMKRSKHPQDPWSGHVSLPGGRWQAGNQDLFATSIRETEEETGIPLRKEDRLGGLDDLSPRTPTYPELVVRPFIFGLRQEPALAPGPEAAACFWARLDSLAGAVSKETFIIAGKPRRLPAFRLGGHTVWGITYRILASFLEMLEY